MQRGSAAVDLQPLQHCLNVNDADGSWGGWVLQSRSGENGVWWTGKLRPVYNVAVPAYEAASSAADTAYGVYNRWAPSWAPFRSATTAHPSNQQPEASK